MSTVPVTGRLPAAGAPPCRRSLAGLLLLLFVAGCGADGPPVPPPAAQATTGQATTGAGVP